MNVAGAHLVHEVDHVWSEGGGVLSHYLYREHRGVIYKLFEDTAGGICFRVSVEGVALLVEVWIRRVVLLKE